MLNHLSLKTSSVFSPLCVCERERKRVRQRERERKKESERERARRKGRRKRERKPERARERVRSHLAGLVSRVSRFSWFDWNQDFLGREWISSSCSICDPETKGQTGIVLVKQGQTFWSNRHRSGQTGSNILVKQASFWSNRHRSGEKRNRSGQLPLRTPHPHRPSLRHPLEGHTVCVNRATT